MSNIVPPNNDRRSWRIVFITIVLMAIVLFISAWALAPQVDGDVMYDIPPWVEIHPAEDCTNGCWTVYQADWQDSDESGGNINIYGTLNLTDTQHPTGGLPWHVFYPDGNVRILTKQPPDVSDFPMYGGCFDPEKTAGPFSAYAGDNPAQSDTVVGMGLPQCNHVTYSIYWIWQTPNGNPPTTTPTQTPHWNYRLYLPIIHD